MTNIRAKFSAATRQAGPATPVGRKPNKSKIDRPASPKFPHCPSRDDAANPSLKRSCHLNMSREGFHQISDPDMELVGRFLAENEKFHGLWECEPCGRWWMRYTRLASWGKREHRWTHIYYSSEETK